MARTEAKNWLGMRLGCFQIERVAIFCILIFHILKRSLIFDKKYKKKKIEEKKNESAISRQTDVQRIRNEHESFETEYFFV